jgi:neutral ceramidase
VSHTEPVSFLAGRGIADITGEIAECGMLGYGMKNQQSAGLHLRLRARAFAFADDGGTRLMLVICELPLMFSSVVQAVLRRLPDGYAESNVLIAATHTHCGPGGYSHHALYNGNTGGFRHATFAAIVDGLVEAAVAAHQDLAPATLLLSHGKLEDASANRSRRAFDRNPEADRALFPEAVDTQTTLLAIERDGQLAGAINWFAVHNTSLTNGNRLVSGDNKGYAAYHWERIVRGQDYLAEGPAPEFIGAFAQTNAGDMSPNLNLSEGSGPTEDMFQNTQIIGTRQYEAAAALAGSVGSMGPGAGAELDGVLDHRIVHVDMSDVRVRPEFTGDGREHRTSHAAGGATALAGAIPDGPTHWKGFGAERNTMLTALSRGVLYRLSRRVRDAQSPKPIALPAGPLNKIVPMVQERLPVQLLRIGRLYLIGLPFEVTINAGLRLRRTVAGITGAELADVLVAGYSNAYGHYTTTPEEYDAQMYEGGSTLFGRWQLAALRQIVAGLAEAMRDGKPAEPGPPAADLSGRKQNRGAKRPAAVTPSVGRAFGDLLSFSQDDEQVVAEFVAAHPGNDVRRGGTYLAVERQDAGGWTRIADDGDWATKLYWTREAGGHATVRIEWDVPAGIAPGRYRLRYNGDDSSGPFTAVTDPFEIKR